MRAIDISINKHTATVYPNLVLQPLLINDSTSDQSEPLSLLGLRLGGEVNIELPEPCEHISIYVKPAVTLKITPSVGLHMGMGVFDSVDGSIGKLLGLGAYGEKEIGGNNAYHIGIEGSFLGFELSGGFITTTPSQVTGGELLIGIDLLNAYRSMIALAMNGG